MLIGAFALQSVHSHAYRLKQLLSRRLVSCRLDMAGTSADQQQAWLRGTRTGWEQQQYWSSAPEAWESYQAGTATGIGSQDWMGKGTGFAFPDPFDPTLPAFLSRGFSVDS